MPINISYVTHYTKGEMLYGGNECNAKVVKVNSDDSIDLEFIPPRDGTYYYYADDGSCSDWTPLPSDKILRGINHNMFLSFRVKWTDKIGHLGQIHWWGNRYGNRIIYGNSPYGVFNLPGDVWQEVPSKQLDDNNMQNFGLGPEWQEIPGTYRWTTRGPGADLYGWERANNYGACWNRYQKLCQKEFVKNTDNYIEGTIHLTKIKEKTFTVITEPIDIYYYRDPEDANKITNGYRDIIKVLPKMRPYPASTSFLAPDGNNNEAVYLVWTSKEDEEAADGFFTYTSRYKFKPELSSTWSNWKEGPSDKLILYEDDPDLYIGDYILEVTGTCNVDEKSYTTKTTVRFTIIDNRDVVRPILNDNLDPTHNNDDYGEELHVSNRNHQVKWPITNKHSYSATYNFYEYSDEGYETKLKYSNVPLKFHRTGDYCVADNIFSENGLYEITVIAKYRYKIISTTASFFIDKRIPNNPTIIVNDKAYKGVYYRNDFDTFIDSVVTSVICPKFTYVYDYHVYYRQFNGDNWEEINEPSQFLVKVGNYKIQTRCKRYPLAQGVTKIKAVSGMSEAIFKVKRKPTYSISLSTNEPTYRVKAYIDFISTDSSDDAEYFASLSKLYRINGGDWKYYIDGLGDSEDCLYIYDNCTIECKSMDEDNFESYITKKEITNIDKLAPVPPEIKNLREGQCITTYDAIEQIEIE